MGKHNMCREFTKTFKYWGQVFLFILPDPSERGALQHYCQPTDITAVKEKSSLKADELSEIQSMAKILPVALVSGILKTRNKKISQLVWNPHSLLILVLTFPCYPSVIFQQEIPVQVFVISALTTFLINNQLHSEFSAKTTRIDFIGFCESSDRSKKTGENSDLLV